MSGLGIGSGSIVVSGLGYCIWTRDRELVHCCVGYCVWTGDRELVHCGVWTGLLCLDWR